MGDEGGSFNSSRVSERCAAEYVTLLVSSASSFDVSATEAASELTYSSKKKCSLEVEEGGELWPAPEPRVGMSVSASLVPSPPPFAKMGPGSPPFSPLDGGPLAIEYKVAPETSFRVFGNFVFENKSTSVR